MLRFALICIFPLFQLCLPEVLKPSLQQACESVQHLVDVETDVQDIFFFVSRSDSSALSKKPLVPPHACFAAAFKKPHAADGLTE